MYCIHATSQTQSTTNQQIQVNALCMLFFCLLVSISSWFLSLFVVMLIKLKKKKKKKLFPDAGKKNHHNMVACNQKLQLMCIACIYNSVECSVFYYYYFSKAMEQKSRKKTNEKLALACINSFFILL